MHKMHFNRQNPADILEKWLVCSRNQSVKVVNYTKFSSFAVIDPSSGIGSWIFAPINFKPPFSDMGKIPKVSGIQ